MKKELLFSLFLLFPACANLSGQEPEEKNAISMSPFIENGAKKVFACKPGPWGQLEYYYIYLEAPDEIMDFVTTPSQKTVWSLPDRDEASLRFFLDQSGVSPSEREKILSNTLLLHRDLPAKLLPPGNVLLNLTPLTRSALAAELRKWPENRFHRSPVIIESGNVREWFAGSGLNDQTVSLIERLSYPLGRSTAFSDVPLVLSQIHSDREERLFLKALTRTRSMILRLKITKESDFVALKSYWSAGNRNKDILPFMESVALSDEIDHVDVTHLLPPLVRKYINTYPSFALGVEGTFPDSLWTSLNFFNHMPEPSFSNAENSLKFIETGFTRGDQPFQFGDLLVIRNGDTGKFLHSCIFIADEIIYTKNGRSTMRPFMLMKLNDLIASYGGNSRLNLEILRENSSGP